MSKFEENIQKNIRKNFTIYKIKNKKVYKKY